MIADIVASVDVAAPPEDVFAALSDWDRQGEWMAFTSVGAVSGSGHAEGERIAGRTGIGPVHFTDPMTITEWDPPRVCRVRHEGWLVRGTAAFSVTPRPDGTSTFTWAEQLDIPFGLPGRVGFALTRPVVVAFVHRSLDRFAVWVPTRTAGRA